MSEQSGQPEQPFVADRPRDRFNGRMDKGQVGIDHFANSKKSPRPDWLSVFALLFAATIPVIAIVPACQKTPLAIDEQVSYFLASGESLGEVYRRTTTQAATPPLPFFAMHGGARLETSNPALTRELSLRATGLLFFFAAIVLSFGLARELAGSGAGAAAAILLGCNAEVLYQATQARPYIYGLFLNQLAGLFVVVLRRVGWRFFAAAGLVVVNIALLWTHFLFASCLVGQLLLAMCIRPRSLISDAISDGDRPARRISLLAVAGLLALAAISLVPLTPMLLRLQTNGPALNWITESRRWSQQLDQIHPIPSAVAIGLALVVWMVRFATGRSAKLDSNRTSPDCREFAGLALWYLLPIFLLWFASRYAGHSLAQPRYYFIQVGPLVIAIAWLLSKLAGGQLAIVFALVLVALDGAPRRFADYWNNPVRHDRHWKEAAELLNHEATGRDLVLMQSGLVESLLVPAQYADATFQGYVCSRLSDFYLRVPLRRLSLPLRWLDGEWQTEYVKAIEKTCKSGGTIYLVQSTDSDLGQSIAQSTSQWLTRQGYRLETLRNEPVAFIQRAVPNSRD